MLIRPFKTDFTLLNIFTIWRKQNLTWCISTFFCRFKKLNQIKKNIFCFKTLTSLTFQLYSGKNFNQRKWFDRSLRKQISIIAFIYYLNKQLYYINKKLLKPNNRCFEFSPFLDLVLSRKADASQMLNSVCLQQFYYSYRGGVKKYSFKNNGSNRFY